MEKPLLCLHPRCAFALRLALLTFACACGADDDDGSAGSGGGAAAGGSAGSSAAGAGSSGSGGMLAMAGAGAGSGGAGRGGSGGAAGTSTAGSAGGAPMRCDPSQFPQRVCDFCDPEDPMKCEVCGMDATCDQPTYTDNGDGTVKSSCCGLVWQQGYAGADLSMFPPYCSDSMPPAGCLTWAEAKDYCATLPLAGGGWRLPFVRELLTLSQQFGSSLWNEEAFPNSPDSWFWTASDHWMVSFGVGQANRVGDKNLRVRCVR